MLRRYRVEAAIGLLLVLTFVAIRFEDLILNRTIVYTPQGVGKTFVSYVYADKQQGGNSTADWNASDPLAWTCHLRAGAAFPICEFGIQFDALPGTKTLDLTNFETFDVDLDYEGTAQQIIFSLKNEDPRYSKMGDGSTNKPNNIYLPSDRKQRSESFSFRDFKVPEWWTTQRNLTPGLSTRQFDRVSALGIAPFATEGDHRFRLKRLTLHGLWISKTSWYLGIIALWIAGTILMLAARVITLKRSYSARRRHQMARRRTLALARTAAERSNRAKSEFLANMGHELRTPLNAILGYAQLLDRPQLEPVDRRAAKVIGDSGRHLLTLIGDLLDLAKIEAARFNLDPEPFDLTDALALVVDMIKVRAEEKDIAFHTSLAPDLPAVVLGDEKRLRQILVNLLGNAVKFTSAGEVSLTVSRLDSSTKGARLRFDVRDTGPGIEAAEMEKLFKRFGQVGEQEGEGTGLGLSISSQLVNLMGSSIEVESQPGEGSRFSFELDLSIVETASEVPSTQHAAEAPAEEEPLAVPAAGELQELLQHARAGKMKDVRREAANIAARDPRYARFAQRVESLAASYQSPALLRLVEQHAVTQRAA